MLTIYRRHLSTCAYASKGRAWKRCQCPIWVQGRLGDDYIRKALDIRSWEAAQECVRDWEAKGAMVEDVKRVTVEHAAEKFIRELGSRHVTQTVIRKFEILLQERLKAFCEGKGIRWLDELEVETVRDFRSTWNILDRSPRKQRGPLGPLTAAKYLERLKQFFKFCLENDWVRRNPAAPLKPAKIKPSPTMPLTEDEYAAVLDACASERIRLMIELLRHSGLRISDASTLERSRLQGDRLLLYTAKSGTPVHLPLPPEVASRLRATVNSNAKYFFWSGASKRRVAATNWRDDITRMLRSAGIPSGGPHRLRDTFAVELLRNGARIENVQQLLGHSSIRVTEKHYAPWVQSRQEALEVDVRKTWKKRALVRVK